MEEYGIMEYLEPDVSGGWGTENLFGVALSLNANLENGSARTRLD